MIAGRDGSDELSAALLRQVIRRHRAEVSAPDFDDLMRKYGRESFAAGTGSVVLINCRRLMSTLFPSIVSTGGGGRSAGEWSEPPTELLVIRGKVQRAARKYSAIDVRASQESRLSGGVSRGGVRSLHSVFESRDFARRGSLLWDDFCDALDSIGMHTDR